ncbi:MAG: phosphoglycerate dehydrogenase [Romboutsia sp.]
MKVLFTINYGEEKFQKIRDLGYDLIHCSQNSVENNEEINDIDVLVTYNPFRTLDINKLKKLKYIQTSSVGIDQIPKEKVLKRDIIVANNKGGYSIPMSEWIVLYILEIYKNRIKFNNQQENKEWKVDFSITELTGKKVGFLGTGTIATEGAKRLSAFGVEIWGVNTKGQEKLYFDKCFESKDMDEIFKNCDVVVSTMPTTEETIGMINKSKFELMKNGSVFINVGRGNIVNEKDLIDYIAKFRGVALDVFENEPLDKENPLWSMKNVIITPHNSWISDRNPERTFLTIYNNLKNYIQNKSIETVVDIVKGY